MDVVDNSVLHFQLVGVESQTSLVQPADPLTLLVYPVGKVFLENIALSRKLDNGVEEKMIRQTSRTWTPLQSSAILDQIR